MVKNIKILTSDNVLEKAKLNKEGIKNIFDFLKEYNFDIILFSGKQLSKESIVSSTNIQGYIVVNDEKREIGVYYKLPYNTKKFLAMYMFSSFVLNGNDEMFADIIYNESIYDKNVYDYASDLLIPDEHLEKLLDGENTDIKMLEDVYKVSKIVIEEKIKRLKKEK